VAGVAGRRGDVGRHGQQWRPFLLPDGAQKGSNRAEVVAAAGRTETSLDQQVQVGLDGGPGEVARLGVRSGLGGECIGQALQSSNVAVDLVVALPGRDPPAQEPFHLVAQPRLRDRVEADQPVRGAGQSHHRRSPGVALELGAGVGGVAELLQGGQDRVPCDAQVLADRASVFQRCAQLVRWVTEQCRWLEVAQGGHELAESGHVELAAPGRRQLQRQRELDPHPFGQAVQPDRFRLRRDARRSHELLERWSPCPPPTVQVSRAQPVRSTLTQTLRRLANGEHGGGVFFGCEGDDLGVEAWIQLQSHPGERLVTSVE